jgi:hypothetical protein
MPDVLSTVQATFNSLDAQYTLLLAASTNPQQRTALENQYAVAQQAYQMCIGKTLSDDDPQVAALSMQLKATNLQVAQSVTEMGDISKVIDTITQAVTLAAKLAAKIAV